MIYTSQEIMQYVKEEDVKFIRLAFCDLFGRQKNISILPSELERAFEQGVAIDASAIPGFGSSAPGTLYDKQRIRIQSMLFPIIVQIFASIMNESAIYYILSSIPRRKIGMNWITHIASCDCQVFKTTIPEKIDS